MTTGNIGEVSEGISKNGRGGRKVVRNGQQQRAMEKIQRQSYSGVISDQPHNRTEEQPCKCLPTTHACVAADQAMNAAK